jgi:hypothetical protein
LLPHPCSQPLCLPQPLIGASGSSGRFACHHTTALSLCASPELCSVLASPLQCWLFALPLLLYFVAFHSLRVWHKKFSSLPHPHSPGQVCHSTPTFSVSVRLQFTLHAFQFCWRDLVCPRAALGYVPGE